ncbi:ornithine cyclodeaminase [Fusarium venenatum]|uniref:ornithine cyclodeaminase n=1 Tax=Fusarium venenatum TaxID=56646 RepID=UPI001D5796B7|nr:ornithine cyclodeaminase [Fusarium venenatum]
MTSCVVLGDPVIHDILINLSRDDTISIKNALGQTLKDFSVGEERKYQPDASVVIRPNGVKTLFRPFTSPTNVGIKITVDPTTSPSYRSAVKKPTIHGIVALCDEEGNPRGILNGDEWTGYRTPLNVMVSYFYRKKTSNVVIFGAGKQALWHLRLALRLRGEDIMNVTIVKRNSEGLSEMIKQISSENDSLWNSPAQFQGINIEDSDSESRLKTVITNADVIFCTTPSKKALFPAEWLLPRLREGRGLYLSAVGSWQPDMLEIDPIILNEVVSTSGYNPSGGPGGVLLVDDREIAQKSTGEFTNSKVKADQIIEIGEVLQWKETWETDKQRHLNNWLEEGFVVYKCVGVGLTDLSAASSIVELAEKYGKGITIGNFSSRL